MAIKLKDLQAALSDAGLPTDDLDELVAALAASDSGGDIALAAKVDELEAALAQAKSEYDTAVKEHQEDVAELTKDLEAALKKSAAPAVAPVRKVGSISLATGLLILGDAALFDRHWRKPQDTRSPYVVDIAGPHAEQLVTRQKQLVTEELCDGKWRIHVPSGKLGADNLKSHAEALIKANEWPDIVTAEPIKGFTQRAIDASRADGLGVISDALSYLGVRASRADVQVSEDGKVVQIVVA